MNERYAVDSSALVAVLKGEAEEDLFAGILAAGGAIVGWPTVFETRIWLLRYAGLERTAWFEEWLREGATQPVAFDEELEALAADAYRRFGKGRHPAALNFGDCMAYAVAARHRVPLLFKGGDFARTDLAVHPASVSS